MNNTVKKVFRGFTLVELMIVMAVFSVLMAGALMLVDPVSKIMSSASVSEKTYSYVNTIQNYVEGSVKYSENLNVYVSDAATDNDILAWAENYRKTYFKNIVSKKQNGYTIYEKDAYVSHMIEVENKKDPKDQVEDKLTEAYWQDDFDALIAAAGAGFSCVVLNDKDEYIRAAKNTSDNIDFSSGTIRIMCLDNQNRGQITLREIPFKSNKSLTIFDIQSHPAQNQLNSAYFDAADSSYSFRYALGASDIMGIDDDFVALQSDYNNTATEIKSFDFSLTVLAARDATGKTLKDSTDTYEYQAFSRPAAASVINLPLMNINRRGSDAVERPYWVTDDVGNYEKDGENPKIQLMSAGTLPKAFLINGAAEYSDPVDLTKNIYFIYNYTDEVN